MESKLIGAIVCQGGDQMWLIVDKVNNRGNTTTYICINERGATFTVGYDSLGIIISFNNNESEFINTKKEG